MSGSGCLLGPWLCCLLEYCTRPLLVAWASSSHGSWVLGASVLRGPYTETRLLCDPASEARRRLLSSCCSLEASHWGCLPFRAWEIGLHLQRDETHRVGRPVFIPAFIDVLPCTPPWELLGLGPLMVTWWAFVMALFDATTCCQLPLLRICSVDAHQRTERSHFFTPSPSCSVRDFDFLPLW